MKTTNFVGDIFDAMEKLQEKIVYRIIIQKTVTRPVTKMVKSSQPQVDAATPQPDVPQVEYKTETTDVFSQNVEGELDVVGVIGVINGLKKAP